ncbi:MAG: P-loop NTPase [Coriobacteriia bacterium]|nr:P-loop NTPase [Coriobacteriia bacterium]
MSENCNHECSNCEHANNCESAEPIKLEPNENSKIARVIGVVSGKGGVGKSLVCGLLATKLQKKGKSVGILDADITGPSVPKMFGITEQLTATEGAMNPAVSKSGIKMVSANLILDNPSNPVAWRGPVISGAIQQFFNQVNWGDVDVLLVDMPPGTSDVFLTVMQSLPIDGIVIATTPQTLVDMIVKKATSLAKMMNIKVLGMVENMAYFKCPDCDKKHYIYGEPDGDATDELPLDANFARMCDDGKIEDIDTDDLLNNIIKEI